MVLAGALDTKGADFAFVRDAIRRTGLGVVCIDFGVLGEAGFAPDVTRAEVAAAGGGDIGDLRRGDRKGEAMAIMARGLTAVVRRLHAEGRVDGMLSMGGSGGTSIATAAMRALPIGVPKLMVSTVAAGDIAAYVGTTDITFMPSVIDVAGLNRISRRIYANAAAAVAGMVAAEAPDASATRPMIAVSMFGNTTAAVERARLRLEKAGFEVLVFHATGTGGRIMERMVRDGLFAGVLDITMTELADEVCGGAMTAGPDRGRAAPSSGIPVVFAPGCVDMANFGGPGSIPARLASRLVYQWNPDVVLLRTDAAENERIGTMIAAAANGARGAATVLLPRGGVSMLDSPGREFWDPGADRACFAAIRRDLKPSVRLVEVDCNINDPEFADLAAETLLGMIGVGERGPHGVHPQHRILDAVPGGA